jgi:DNA-3-methyladenine glycosylase II
MTRSGAPTAAELRALARRDPALGAALRRLPPFPGFPQGAERPADSHFHALARAVVYQMLSGRAAATIHARVHALTPGSRFATPQQMLALPQDELRAAGLSRAKAAALHDLAERSLDGRLPLRSIARRPDDEVVAAIAEVRGIGPWTAQMFLIFRLGRLDVMPSTDLGVQEGLRRLDGLTERPTPRELAARAEVWAPLRSVASWALWRLADETLDPPAL